MTYVVNESCIRCKIMDCVDVCPVDCFYEGENMLVIHPEERVFSASAPGIGAPLPLGTGRRQAGTDQDGECREQA